MKKEQSPHPNRLVATLSNSNCELYSTNSFFCIATHRSHFFYIYDRAYVRVQDGSTRSGEQKGWTE